MNAPQKPADDYLIEFGFYMPEHKVTPNADRTTYMDVAAKFADDYLQLTDGYWMEFDESKNMVLCHTNEQDYTIYLYQPIKDRWDPEFDIYAVSGYEYTETDINGDEQSRHYHVGNDPWASLHIESAE